MGEKSRPTRGGIIVEEWISKRDNREKEKIALRDKGDEAKNPTNGNKITPRETWFHRGSFFPGLWPSSRNYRAINSATMRTCFAERIRRARFAGESKTRGEKERERERQGSQREVERRRRMARLNFNSREISRNSRSAEARIPPWRLF